MNSSQDSDRRRIVVDPIHGDVELTAEEWRVVDTASFQRLRHIKQLGFGHLTYPNATHTRFAHSIGVYAIMRRILDIAKKNRLGLTDEQDQNLRFAALLHDIGHYPYSHLMEGMETVQLVEELTQSGDSGKRQLNVSAYPGHVQLGKFVTTVRQDLIETIGSQERARTVSDMFARTEAADAQLSKLINSSFDMDRLDYLLRDSLAAGVPFGQIDIDYLLNSLEISPSKMVGVSEKALYAAEHYLFARYFMHLTVYYHKTTCGLEEAARQLLRRIRDTKAKEYDLPQDGNEVEERARSAKFLAFNDGFVDEVVRRACDDPIEAIQNLAKCIQDRRPPKLLKEVAVLPKRGTTHHAGSSFKKDCRQKLSELATKSKVPIEQFLFCQTKALTLEKRGVEIAADEADALEPEEADELIKVFIGDAAEPVSIVDVDRSLLNKCAQHGFQLYRLYFVYADGSQKSLIPDLRKSVQSWGSAD